jgi:glutathione peroxidase
MNPLKAFLGTMSTTDNDVVKKASASIYDIEIKSLQNQPINLSEFKGKKILFVNVASKCGFTPQYKELQQLQDQYKNNLVIIGLPCNQFGKQEPGKASEGSEQHKLYQWLTKKSINGKQNSTVKWNFQKYLVDEDGEFINFFFSITKPMSSKITSNLK